MENDEIVNNNRRKAKNCLKKDNSSLLLFVHLQYKRENDTIKVGKEKAKKKIVQK